MNLKLRVCPGFSTSHHFGKFPSGLVLVGRYHRLPRRLQHPSWYPQGLKVLEQELPWSSHSSWEGLLAPGPLMGHTAHTRGQNHGAGLKRAAGKEICKGSRQ